MKLYVDTAYPAMGLVNDREDDVTQRMKTATFKRRIDTIRHYIGHSVQQPRVLDCGCATGFFLEVAAREGLDCYGVEISPLAAGFAREKIGTERIFCGTLESAAYPRDYFDAIFMSDFLEHTRNPDEIMQIACRILKPEGVIDIVTPDTNSVTSRLMRSRWTHYKLEHLFYFNDKSMFRLAARHQLRIIHRTRAVKMMTLMYFHNHYTQYRQPVLTPLVDILYRCCPPGMRKKLVPISIGETEYVLEKAGAVV